MRIIAILLVVAALAVARPGSAETVQAGACRIDTELMKLPNCAVRRSSGHLYVIKPLTDIAFANSRDEFQAAFLPGSDGWAWFDRTGLVRVTHVATMDNYANEFHHGLVRVTRNGKWGLSDTHGTVVVPPTYDGMYDYEENIGWRACKGCRTLEDGGGRWYEGGTEVILDRTGKVAGVGVDR